MSIDLVDGLDRALSQHRQWKAILIRDVENGSTQFDADSVRVDHRCEMGKWLHSGLPSVIVRDPRFDRIKQLHAQFHVQAALVVTLIRAHKIPAAQAEMERGSYASLTMQLVRELSIWIAELRTTAAAVYSR